MHTTKDCPIPIISIPRSQKLDVLSRKVHRYSLSNKKPYHICVLFQCPVCPKKTGKVQNFKDHIKRHLVALGQGGNAESNAASSVKTPQFLSAPTRHRQCPFCRNEMLSTELSQVSIIKVVLIFITYTRGPLDSFASHNI